MSCFQCDLDIPHVCYHGMPGSRWGMTDEAVVALEAVQRIFRSPPQGGDLEDEGGASRGPVRRSHRPPGRRRGPR